MPAHALRLHQQCAALCLLPVFFLDHLQTGELGQGTFGVVIKALDLRTHPPVEVAIKLLPRGDFVKNYKTYVKREIQNQSGLRHPLIVSIKEVSGVQMLT